MCSQIDRLLAIWQATHPNSWFNGKDDLVPFTFLNEAGRKEYWTSDKVRKPDVFGYTYSDIDSGQNPESLRKRYLDKYRWASQDRLRNPPRGMEPLPIFEKAQVFRYDGPTKDLLIAESTKTGALDAVLKIAPARQVAQIALSSPIVEQQTILSASVGSETPIVEHRVLPKLTPSNLAITNAHDVEEAMVERTWYVDNIVQR